MTLTARKYIQNLTNEPGEYLMDGMAELMDDLIEGSADVVGFVPQSLPECLVAGPHTPPTDHLLADPEELLGRASTQFIRFCQTIFI